MHTASSKPKLLPILKGVLVESVAWDKEQVRAHVRRCAAAVLWHSAPGGMQRRRHEPCRRPRRGSRAPCGQFHRSHCVLGGVRTVARRGGMPRGTSRGGTGRGIAGVGGTDARHPDRHRRAHASRPRTRARTGAATEAAPRPFLPSSSEGTRWVRPGFTGEGQIYKCLIEGGKEKYLKLVYAPAAAAAAASLSCILYDAL